ncbi:hypothetical protein [Parasediminibacterium sp. JCM 36343]|uniref:hypothetical protein n=1 Tax=Parasediminibacterium sp. JCM 36343 TaxID=3374279 RepID=UPI00397C7DEF
MKKSVIKERLHQYIEIAGGKQLKAIYTIVGDDIVASPNRWDDDTFVSEMDKRNASFINGTAKVFTWEEVQERAEKALKGQKGK